MNPDEQQQSSKKWLWIGLAAFFFLLLAAGIVWYFFGGTKAGDNTQNPLPFGAPSDTSDTRTDTTGNRHEIDGGPSGGFTETSSERLFRQLANVPIAGAFALERNGEQYVRYIEKETGHAYEVALTRGEPREITNTTIPRIALADWADNGNAVLLRYLEQDPLSGREDIKTYLAHLPAEASAKSGLSTASSSADSTGSLTMEFLPDNIIALSVAPDGKSFFYLIRKGSEVSGSMVNVSTRITREVFRHSFTEWTPQLLNDDTIILTTKPSGAVPGFSYLYDPKTKTLKRLVREKNGLTISGNATGSHFLFGENIARTATLGVYNPKGFVGDEGFVFYEKTLPLTTLPEKCAWHRDGIKLLCGAFISVPSGAIPDLWYQGRVFFSDTFWSLDTDTDDIVYIADPKEETGQEFDVMDPMLSKNDAYFIFTNKRDGTLWSMRILQKEAPTESSSFPADLSPAELQDAQGSLPQ